jgi:hypothetical protein
MAIIIKKEGSKSRKLDPLFFKEEAEMQELIANDPNILPLYEIKEDIRLLTIAREFTVESGSIDVLGIDREGNIYIIEAKLCKNSTRRQIIAQLLDYAASLWSHIDYAGFLEEANIGTNVLFKKNVSEKAIEFFELQDTDDLFANLRNNLQSGSFRFVVLMDEIDDKLRDVIIFLNQNTHFDIYAVELERYHFDNYEIVIPKLFGAEVKKNMGIAPRSGERRQWDEASFFEDITKKLNPKEREAVTILYESMKKLDGKITWGTGKKVSSFSPKFEKLSSRSPLSVYSDGRLQLSFGYMDDNKIAEAFREEWKQQLQNNVKLKFEKNQDFPNVRKEDWIPKMDLIIESFTDLINNLK